MYTFTLKKNKIFIIDMKSSPDSYCVDYYQWFYIERGALQFILNFSKNLCYVENPNWSIVMTFGGIVQKYRESLTVE